MEELLVGISVYAIPVLLAITVHEFCHGYAAYRLGDPTAKLMGRLTLNPLPHIDIFGTVILPVMLVLINSPFLVAWAKPVPINPLNFRKPYRDMAISSAAGPLSNFALCILFIIVYKLTLTAGDGAFGGNGELFAKMSLAGFSINFTLFAFNLLPIPPLDGGRVLAGVLPRKYREFVDRIEPYGFLIIMGLIVLRVFDVYMSFVFRIFKFLLRGLL